MVLISAAGALDVDLFAFLFGSLGTRIGTKNALFIALGVYTLTAIVGYFMTTTTHFFTRPRTLRM